jgi:hypothetical protein
MTRAAMSMRERAREEHAGTHGKFSSPMAALLFDRMLEGFGDGEDSFTDPDGSGDWLEHYGKGRVLFGDDRGFVYWLRLGEDYATFVAGHFPPEDEDEEG